MSDPTTAQQPSTQVSTVPMFDDQGTLRDVPYDRMKEVTQHGFKPAVRFQFDGDNNDDGTPKTRYVPADKMKEAAAQPNAKMLPIQDQDIAHPGWGHYLSDLAGLLHPAALNPYPGMGLEQKQEAAQQSLQQDQSRQAAGYSLPYRALAPVAQAVGTNVPGMEQSAKEGDVQGVYAHAAAGATVAAAPLIAEGAIRAGAATADAVPGALSATADAAKTVASKTPILKTFVDGPPGDLMTRAVKPRASNTGFNAAVQTALPNMKAAEADLGHPVQGIEDALQTADIAKKKLWDQYQQKLGPAAERGVQIDGNAIADSMMQSIDQRTAVQNPDLVNKVAARADTYRRPLNLDEAEDFLQSANNDLHNYYAKNKVGQRVAQGDPEMASTVAEADALRSGLYSKLDEVSGPGAADLKRQYGALSNVQEEMLNRKNIAARQQPQSLNEQISTARGAGKIIKGIATMSPGDVMEGAEGIATSKWLKERGSSDAMIQRAFEATQPANTATIPNRPIYIRGLLNRGPVQVGGSPDTSGSVPFTPPPIAGTTRAQRLGLLLPEKTSTDLPPSSAEAPMQILPAKSRVIRDPRTGQMRRQYLPVGQGQ